MLDFVDGIDRLQELTLLGKFRISSWMRKKESAQAVLDFHSFLNLDPST